MSTDLNNAVHRLRQNQYAATVDGRAARRADVEHLSHALGLAEDTIERLVGELAQHVNGTTSMGEPALPHADDIAVDRFAAAMKEKLAYARAKGRGGWQDKSDCTQQRLSDMLRAHVEKGDPRDVANFCMFLHQREEAILPVERDGLPGEWKMVPVEPTPEMIAACIDCWQERVKRKAEAGTLLCGGDPERSFRENWNAMLAAVPSKEMSRG